MVRPTRASPRSATSSTTRRAALAIALLAAAGASSAASTLCASSGNSQNYEWVSRVSIAGNNVTVARTGYQDSTGTAIALQAGQSYPVEVDVRTNGTTYKEYVKFWFDLDQSGSIDNSELVFDQNATFAGLRTFSGTVTIPSSAFNGSMDVRMIMQYNGSPPLCGTYGFGTTVDLRVSVSGGVNNPGPLAAPTGVSAVAGSARATVSFTPPSPGAESYQVVSTPGGITATGTGSPIVVTGLANGTSYTFTVASKSGTVTSAPSAPSNAVVPSAPSIALSTSFLVAGTYGAAYSQGVSASGAVAPYAFTVSAGSLPPGLSLSPNGTVSGTPSAAGAYTFTITATDSSPAGVGGPFSGSQQVTLGIAKAQQQIAFGAAPVLTVGQSGPIAAIGGGSGNPVVVTSLTPATCSLSGSTVNALGAGTCSLSAQQAGDANYDPAPQALQSFTIQKIAQAIAFGAAPALTVGSSGPIAVSGGGSGNPVVLASLTPGICALSGTTVNALAAGTCSLSAQQAGNANYEPAPEAFQSFAIEKVTQAIAFEAPRLAVLGNARLVASGGPSGNPVTLASGTPGTCKVEGDRVFSVARGACRIVAFQAGTNVYKEAGPTEFIVNPFDPVANLTGLWWHPAEPGWGVSINHQDDTLFATLFIYAADGTPTWLVASGAHWDGAVFSGTLYRTSVPAFDREPWPAVTVVPAGEVTMTFAGPGKGTVHYTYHVGGVTRSGSRDIEPMIFGDAKPTCVSSTGTRAGERVFQDQWWKPEEPGWGLEVAHQGKTLFATLFTYDEAGKATWVVAPNMQPQEDGGHAGDLVRTAKLPQAGEAWAGFSSASVGSMRLRFGDGDNGLLEYTLDGRSVRKQVTRRVFGETVPACR